MRYSTSKVNFKTEEKLAIIEKHLKQMRELLNKYQAAFKDFVVAQGNNPAYNKDGEMSEEIGTKYEDAEGIHSEIKDEIDRLCPIEFLNNPRISPQN